MAKATNKKSTKKNVKEIVEEKATATSSSESNSSSSSSESESESSSSDESSSDESSSSSDSSSEDESSSDSSSESESSEEEEEEESKKKEEQQKESSSDSSSEDESSSSSSDSSSSESDSSSSESESDSSDDDDEEKSKKEEEQKESSSDDESSSSSDSSSSDSESESSAEEQEQESKKRKLEEEEEDDDDEKESAEQQSLTSKKSKPSEPATIFVGRLSWSIDDEWLKNEFEHIGGVLGARVIMERGSNRSRGYGYVDFESVEFAEKAIKEMHGKEIDGRPINCDMSTSKPSGPSASFGERAKKYGDVPSEPSDTLFLGNLSFNVSRDQLYDLFGKYGEIVSVRIPTHPETEQPKGFGYVQFANKDDAKKALDALQGEYIENRPVRLDFSTPRPPRDNSNNRGNNRGNNGSRREFRGSGANNAPLGKQRNTATFAGTKKTFD